MCIFPEMYGGGVSIEYICFFDSGLNLKIFSFSQSVFIFGSTSVKSYAFFFGLSLRVIVVGKIGYLKDC